MGSQEDEISKLLSPSIYYGDCYAVEVILSLIYATLGSVEMTKQGFYASALKSGVLLRNMVELIF